MNASALILAARLRDGSNGAFAAPVRHQFKPRKQPAPATVTDMWRLAKALGQGRMQVCAPLIHPRQFDRGLGRHDQGTAPQHRWAIQLPFAAGINQIAPLAADNDADNDVDNDRRCGFGMAGKYMTHA